jgi:CRP-like cAMP-binding protein
VDVGAHFKGARNVSSISSEISVGGGDVVEVATPGALLGEVALVDSSARSATVITRSDSKLVVVDGKQFDLLVRESPEFARHVMAVMGGRCPRPATEVAIAALALSA